MVGHSFHLFAPFFSSCCFNSADRLSPHGRKDIHCQSYLQPASLPILAGKEGKRLFSARARITTLEHTLFGLARDMSMDYSWLGHMPNCLTISEMRQCDSQNHLNRVDLAIWSSTSKVMSSEQGKKCTHYSSFYWLLVITTQ